MLRLSAITLVLVLAAFAVLLAGCTGNSPQAANASAQTNASVKNTSIGVEPMNETVVLETSKGTIEIELNRAKAPATAANFLAYVKSGYYDGTVFHRVIPGFMAQGGGFTPGGTQKPTNAPIRLESNNGLKNLRGTIAMARTNDPNSATSQFFINVADNSFLDYAPGNPGYAVFGKVVSGMDAVDAIVQSQAGSRGPYDDWPVQDVVITRAVVKS